MVLAIYQVVLMSLMFIFSLTSFTFMIISLTKYIKNKNIRDIKNRKKEIADEMAIISSSITASQDEIEVKSLIEKFNLLNAELETLNSKKK